MSSRSHWVFLLAPLVYACGAEGDPGASDNIELPFGMGPLADSSVAADASAVDAATKPAVRADAGVVPVVEDPLDEGSACAASSLAAEQVVIEEEVQVEVTTHSPAPVALYVMFDKSSSMAGSLWKPAVKALTQFIRDPESSGIDMALQYFPNGGSCNGSGYSAPSVALGRLPAHADTLSTDLAKQSANGFGTPIEGALRGATEYCKSFQAAHADERCVAVLVTDGKPEWDTCEKDDARLTAIAEAAWTQSQVRTFAVGLSGADFGLLDKIAKAGGAADCDPNSARFSCDVSGGADKLTEALAKIRATVTTVQSHTELQTKTQTRPLECEWRMPAPEEGKELDTDRVNVTLSGSSSTLPLGRVPGADSCRANGWYYDVPAAPQRIVACPEACAAIEAAHYTDVKILLGCQTNTILL